LFIRLQQYCRERPQLYPASKTSPVKHFSMKKKRLGPRKKKMEEEFAPTELIKISLCAIRIALEMYHGRLTAAFALKEISKSQFELKKKQITDHIKAHLVDFDLQQDPVLIAGMYQSFAKSLLDDAENYTPARTFLPGTPQIDPVTNLN
jgi:hypothetical protein